MTNILLKKTTGENLGEKPEVQARPRKKMSVEGQHAESNNIQAYEKTTKKGCAPTKSQDCKRGQSTGNARPNAAEWEKARRKGEKALN